MAVASMPFGVYLFQLEQPKAVKRSTTVSEARVFFIASSSARTRGASAEPAWGRNYGTLSGPGKNDGDSHNSFVWRVSRDRSPRNSAADRQPKIASAPRLARPSSQYS